MDSGTLTGVDPSNEAPQVEAEETTVGKGSETTAENGNGLAAQFGNEPATQAAVPVGAESLLQRLEEQNRLLLEDRRCHTRILTRSGSYPNVSGLGSTLKPSSGSTSSLRTSSQEGGGKKTLSLSPSPPPPLTTSTSQPLSQASPPSQPSQASHPSSASPAGGSYLPEEVVKEKPRVLKDEVDSDFDDLGGGDLGPSSVLLLDSDMVTDEELAILLQHGHLDDLAVVGFDPGLVEQPGTDTRQSQEDSLIIIKKCPSDGELTRQAIGSDSHLVESASKIEAASELVRNSSRTLDTANGEIPSGQPEDGACGEIPSGQPEDGASGGVPSGQPEDRASGGVPSGQAEDGASGGVPSGQAEEAGAASIEEEEEEGKTEVRDSFSELKEMVSSLVRRNRPRSESEIGASKGAFSITSSKGTGSIRKRSQTMAAIIREQSEGDEEIDKLSAEQDLWQTWSTLLKSWEDSFKKNHNLIKQLARQGIPEHLRAMAWQLLSNSQDLELKERYPSLITEVSPFERQIQRDLARTFPEHSFFKERDGLGQESLFNILKAYSVHDREVGYCQGSPFIAGLLLMQMPEEDAFCVLVKMMENYRLRDLFKPSMADLSLCFYQLEKTVEELFPQLHLHFQAVGFHTSMYASPWFLTMFASVLSLGVVFRIMDMFLVEGRDVIFKVGLALLEHSQNQLIQLDMEDMLKLFQKEMKAIHEAEPNTMILRASKVKLKKKKMKRWEKEYVYRKEKKAVENSELVRLQAENTELSQRISALEKECASLADRLIQGQVTRAEEAEEMFILKKDLAQMRRKVATIEEERVQTGSSVDVGSKDCGDVCVVKAEGASDASEAPSEGGEGGDVMTSVGEEHRTEEPVHIHTEPLSEVGDAAPDPDLPGSPLPETPSPRPSTSSASPTTPSTPTPGTPTPSTPTPGTPTPSTPTPSTTSSSSSSHKKRKDSKRSKKTKFSPPPSLGEYEVKKEKHHKFHKRWSKSNPPANLDIGRKEVISPEVESPLSILKRKKSVKTSPIVDLTRELALAKTNYADASNCFEQKKLELKQALQREAFVVRELRAAKEYIAALEQKLSTVQMERHQCPHCAQQMLQGPPAQQEDECGMFEGPADPNSSEVLYSSLQAMWSSTQCTDDCSTDPRHSLDASSSPEYGHNGT